MATRRLPDLKKQLGVVIDELVDRGVPLEQARSEFERQYVIAALRDNDGNVGRSSEALGVHRNTLRNKVTSLRIQPRDYR